MKNKQKIFNFNFKLCSSRGSSLVLWADAQVTFHLYAMSPLKDKLEVVRKNIHVDPHKEETLLWTKALAGA